MGVWGFGGSSPRVRGKPLLHGVAALADGLIPARAGKTSPGAAAACAGWAHPRACGENEVAGRGGEVPCGSSPRVRGKHAQEGALVVPRRLIPARAGKTSPPGCSSRHTPAHPRACGENGDCLPGCGPVGGSSPRVRGKPARADVVVAVPRLIPARAGKTPTVLPRARTLWAHPRACGENITAALDIISGVGSSPRVRGKRP